MSYAPVPFDRFDGGLNLRDNVDAVEKSQCIDVLNCTFTDRGALKQRYGYGKLTAGEGTTRYDSLAPFYTSSGSTVQLVAGAGNRLDVISTAGAVAANSTAPTASPHYFARFGSPAGERLYIANGTDTVRYWDGSAFTTPAYTGTTITGKFLAVQASDNRLINARTTGTSAGVNPSSVRFSNEGDPHTFGANNYVDLTPGDGEQIMGVIAWRELVFVFKESKFFVFYGTSTAADGNPEFNYRPVDTGVGLASSRALVSCDDGVYFLDRKGVYRTQGSEPQKVSDIIDPLFFGGPSDFFQSSVLNHGNITNASMTRVDDNIYLGASTTASTNDRTLVYNTQNQWWTLYDLPAAALASFQISSQPELVFAYASGLKHIGRMNSSYTSDDGTATSARWRSGWYDFNSPDLKTIRESKAWGSGMCEAVFTKDFRIPRSNPQTVAFSPAADLWGDGTGTDSWGAGAGSDLWGPTTTITPKLIRKAIRGTTFSVQFQNAVLNRTFEIHRLANYLRETRQPSTVKVAS